MTRLSQPSFFYIGTFNFYINKRCRVKDFHVQIDKTFLLYVAIAAFDAKGCLMIRSQFSTMDITKLLNQAYNIGIRSVRQ